MRTSEVSPWCRRAEKRRLRESVAWARDAACNQGRGEAAGMYDLRPLVVAIPKVRTLRPAEPGIPLARPPARTPPIRARSCLGDGAVGLQPESARFLPDAGQKQENACACYSYEAGSQLESEAAFKHLSHTMSGVCTRSDTLVRETARSLRPRGREQFQGPS